MNREAAGLYIHVPFCSAICPYCDFAVLRGGESKRRSYVEALLVEIASWEHAFEPVDTVYFGGGTPSLLAAHQIADILGALRKSFSFLPNTVMTVEVNPEDAQAGKLREFRDLGFSMISLGVQSFDEKGLSFLGRRHNPKQARESVIESRKTGFEIVSLDLIYGLPEQDRKAWREELKSALELSPDHLSCYQLTIEPKTSFGKRSACGELRALSGNEQAEFFFDTHLWLGERGFEAYEVSNFARSESHRSPHNRKYWRHTPYLGLGPSAHSFRGQERWWNHEHLETWMRELAAGGTAIAEKEELSESQLALEFVMLSLRQPAGIDLDLFSRRFGSELIDGNQELVFELTRESLLRQEGRHLRPSLRGLAVAEALAASFKLPVDLLHRH